MEPSLLVDFGIIAQLVILEGLLSFDNALALAALVDKRLTDPLDRKRALTWGIGGAYLFRTIMIFIGVWLMNYPWIRIGAGAYLLWLAFDELIRKPYLHKKSTENPCEIDNKPGLLVWLSPFWSTVISVELMDIMFSIDSIGVALALSSKIWVLITGAAIGILMMRIAAQFFLHLIKHFPILTKTAFVLVALAGINIILDAHDVPLPFLGGRTFTIGLGIPEVPFLSLLFAIFVGSIVWECLRQRSSSHTPSSTN